MSSPHHSLPARQLLSIQLSSVGARGVVVRPRGEIDLLTARLLEQVLDHQLTGHHWVVLDLVEVSYFGGRGLGVVQRAQETAHRHGTRFHTIAPRGHVAIRVASLVGREVAIHVSPDEGSSSAPFPGVPRPREPQPCN